MRSQLTASVTTRLLKGKLLIWAMSQTTAICAVANLDLKSPNAGCQIVRDPCLRGVAVWAAQIQLDLSTFPSTSHA